jgi:hypothetical protein
MRRFLFRQILALVCVRNELRREIDLEFHHLVIAHGLAFAGKLQPAADQIRILELLQMHDQQWPADADLARQLAHVIRLVDERRDDL